jgi:hypothetical protein
MSCSRIESQKDKSQENGHARPSNDELEHVRNVGHNFLMPGYSLVIAAKEICVRISVGHA